MGQCRYISRAKRPPPPPPKKRALYTAMERDRARDGAVESALRRLTVFSSSVNASSVVKAILDSHSFFWGDFQRENDTGHRRTSFSLSTASKAARPVLVDPGRPSPPREPPLVTLPLGWPNNRLNMMMAKALFWGNFVRRFVPGVDTKKEGGGCPRK